MTIPELTLENTTIVIDEFTMAFRLSITKVTDIRAASNIVLNSSAVLVTVTEESFVDVAYVRFEDTIAPRLVV